MYGPELWVFITHITLKPSLIAFSPNRESIGTAGLYLMVHPKFTNDLCQHIYIQNISLFLQILLKGFTPFEVPL